MVDTGNEFLITPSRPLSEIRQKRYCQKRYCFKRDNFLSENILNLKHVYKMATIVKQAQIMAT